MSKATSAAIAKAINKIPFDLIQFLQAVAEPLGLSEKFVADVFDLGDCV